MRTNKTVPAYTREPRKTMASCGRQLATALGPSLNGLLHDAFGSYSAALITAATLDVVAAVVVIFGRRQLLTTLT